MHIEKEDMEIYCATEMRKTEHSRFPWDIGCICLAFWPK